MRGHFFGGIYCISEGENGLYKIGVTKCPTYRINDLQMGNPRKIYLNFYIECSDVRDKEKVIHDRFGEKHIRGEWFDVRPCDIIDAMHELARKIIEDSTK